jgi:N-acetylglucosaminyldiphosphoundecaprenol N-acetyl-beta-D-mannosaminyltransferase
MYQQEKSLSEVMILGVPVDNFTLDSAVQRIISFISDFKIDKRPRQVATVNVDFLMNSLSWSSSKTARHPELLDIIRSADMVTADGMPIVWLSRLLKAPLKGRVTGADLVPALSEAIEKTGHSIFFLGGKGDIGQQAADKLKTQLPDLNIAGVYSPFVYTEGEEMLDSKEQDEEIIKHINETYPDILLIGFGNPKQELWFNRNKHKLNAAVTIGIGGTYEFIVGNVSRAPIWIQNSGMEWIYRIFQEPKRLWKRYVIGLSKLSVLTLPMLSRSFLHRTKNQSLIQSNQAFPSDIKPGSDLNEVKIILSKKLTSESMKVFIDHWETYTFKNKKVIFDYIDVEYIDPNALGILVRFYKRLQNKGIKTLTDGLVNKEVVDLFKVNHMWDLINTQNPLPKLSIKDNEKNKQFLRINEKTIDYTLATLYGRLDANLVAKIDFSDIKQTLGENDLILDLSHLDFIDSTGLRLFFYLQKKFKMENKNIFLMNPNQLVSQLLNITNLSNFFNVVNERKSVIEILNQK